MGGENIAELQSVTQFVESAEYFCALLEGSDALTSAQFLTSLADSLATLYKTALYLPEVEPDEVLPHDLEAIRELAKTSPTSENWTMFYHNLASYQQYYERNNPGEAPNVLFLSADLLETWEDIKRELLVFRRGSDAYMREAVWQWRFGFRHHWGRHLVNALRGVHWIISDYLHMQEENS